MNEIKTGGPAFPFFQPDENGTMSDGMNLRDYFAAKALQQWTAGCEVCDHPDLYNRFADHCYRLADAMIRARGEA